MAEQAKENGGKMDDMTWEELAKDARDRLETCQMVGLFYLSLKRRLNEVVFQLHLNEQHPDKPLLGHVRELIGKLETAGIQASAADEEDGDEGEWVDENSEDEDGDVEMS